MSYKICLIALTALSCTLLVLGAAIDESQLSSQSDLVVEKQDNGQQPATVVDVNAVPEECHQPKETGRCFALFYRFAYNLDTHACEEFVYGGCAGNSNNFNTKELCEQTCMGKAAPSTESATEQAADVTTVEPQSDDSSTKSTSD